jgi:CheY-like chemotaxis protein
VENHDKPWHQSWNRQCSEIVLGTTPRPSQLAIEPSNRTNISTGRPAPPTRPNSPSINKTLAALHILIVDSNHLVLKLLRRYLTKGRLNTVVAACNGVEAVAAVRDAHRKNYFDLIFIDISTPGIDGSEVVKLIRSLERDPVSCNAYENEDGLLVPSEGSARWVCNDLDRDESNKSYIVALTDSSGAGGRVQPEEGGFDGIFTKPIAFPKIGSLLKRWNSAGTIANL